MVRSAEPLLAFVLDLYRLAQDTHVAEFPDLALEMLKANVIFSSATWSEAEITRSKEVKIFSVHLHNEPEEVRQKFSALNQKHARRVFAVAEQPGRASVLNDTCAFFTRRDEEPMRAYMRRYGHERNMLITALGQWLSLYRQRQEASFTEADCALVDTLMPHLVEALAINRALAVGARAAPNARPVGSHALIDGKGAFLHCGKHFFDLLRQEWRDWSEPRIPQALLAVLSRERQALIAGGTVEIMAQPVGRALLLTGRRVSPLGCLSARELAIAREFGAGKPYKTIARDLGLAPATVRNVVQNAYRKLDIDNKAALATLLERDRADELWVSSR